MKIINPKGTKKIILSTPNEVQEIFLEDFSDENTEFNLRVELAAANTECRISGRLSAKKSQKKVWNIDQFFLGKKQKGNIDVRGVAEDESFVEISGRGVLTENSENASAHISEKLMLFGNGKGKLLPVLRVETDQVEAASHGATIAPVEPEKLLYFASRGISKISSEKIIKEGFLN